MRTFADRIKRRGPFILCHLVTAHCNCACESCLWRNNASRDLPLDEIKKLHRDAAEIGFIINFLWGGEPLLRKDIPEILKSSKQTGLLNVVTTNGWFLEERLGEIAPYTDCFIVSLDHPSEKHDDIRRKSGLYRRVINGIEAAKANYPEIKVMINTLLTNSNVEAIEDLVTLAEKLRVSIYVSWMEIDLLRSKKMEGAKIHLKPTLEEEAAVARQLMMLKRAGYGINNSYLYLNSLARGKMPYRCHFPKLVLQVGPEGEVIDCRAWDRPIGFIHRHGLKEIYRSTRLKELAGPEGERCNKCNNPNRIDLSFFWELKPEPFWAILKMFLSQ